MYLLYKWSVCSDSLSSLYIDFRPFQRTAADNDKLFTILRTFPYFQEHIPEPVLKELCVVAVNEIWKDPEFTSMNGVAPLSNTNWQLILDGSLLFLDI